MLSQLLNLAEGTPFPPALSKTRYTSDKSFQDHPSSPALPPTGAGPHASTVQAHSLLSLCHYTVVNSAVYSVINHHLEGSAGSNRKGSIPAGGFSVISQK